MPEEQDQILIDAYETWKQNPITVLMFKVLAKHRDNFVSQVIASAGDAGVSDSHARMIAYGLKTSHTIIQSLISFETFKKHIDNNKTK